MSSDLYFLVEGGKTLELAKAHIAARYATHERNAQFAGRFGATKWRESIFDGTVHSVRLDGPDPSFRKADRFGFTMPKKTSPIWKEWQAQTGYDRMGGALAQELGIPHVIEYRSEDSNGWSSVSGDFSAGTGFLWLGRDSPICLYVPDVATLVQEYREKGYTVDTTWPEEFDGARPILKEEWELVVAQFNLAEAKK